MIPESDKSAGAVEAAFEEMKARGSIEVVLHVVLAAPEQFDRRARLLGNPSGPAMKSLRNRLQKPPPTRVLTAMSVWGIPNVADTNLAPGPGFCVGAQSVTLPLSKCAVQFCGSRLMWAKKG
jgi:hypothetical protein